MDAQQSSDLALLRAALDVLPDAVIVLRAVRDRAGTIGDFECVYANAPAARLLDHELATLPGRRLLELAPSSREDGSFARYARVVETGTPAELEVRREHEGEE